MTVATDPGGGIDLAALSDQELMEIADLASALASPAGLAAQCWGPQWASRDHTDRISSAFVELMEGRYDRLAIFTPPQVGKSISAGVWGTFWWLVNQPRSHCAVISYGSLLAINKGRMVRRLVNDYGSRYGLMLSRDSKAVNNWSLTAGGGMRSVGLAGSLTGLTVNGVMVIDDPHKDRAEAESKVMREKVHDWYSSTGITRLAPGTPAVLIQTRWHPDDLAGRRIKEEGTLEEGGRWKVLNMGAFAREGDPLGRPLGAPLPHPEIAPEDTEAAREYWEKKRAESKPRDWGAMFMGDPKPAEGALLSREMIAARTVWGQIPPAVRTAVGVDPSGGGRDTAGIIGGHVDADGVLYWTHDRSAQMPSDEWAKEACLLAVEIDADVIVIEANYGGDQPEKLIRLTWKLLHDEWEKDNPRAEEMGEENPFGGIPPRLESVSARKGKVIRADPVSGFVRMDRIRFGPGLGELGEEWATYQQGSPDSPGALDASVVLAYFLVRALPKGMVVSTAAGVSKGSVGASPSGGAFGGGSAVGARIGRRGAGGR